MKYIKLLLIGVVIVALVVVFGVKNLHKQTASGTVTVGAALALTGDAAAWGEAEKNGINLALQEINTEAVTNRKLEVNFEDSKSTSDGGLAAVQKLISVNNAKYIIGPTWLDSYPGAQGVVKGKSVVLITPSASITAVQQGTPITNVFSTWYRTDALVTGLVQSLKTQNKIKVAVVFQNDAYFQEFKDSFLKQAKDQGITIASEDLINPGQYDFKTLFTKIKSENVDAIVYAMYDEQMVDTFLKNHHQIISSAPLYTQDSVLGYYTNPQYKSLLEGATFVENAEMPANFIAKYKVAYGVDPTLSASTAYDAMNIIAQTIEKGGSDPVKYLKSASFQTVSFGNTKFDSIGGIETRNKQYQVRQVINGQIQ